MSRALLAFVFGLCCLAPLRATAQSMLNDILIDGEGWQLVAEGFAFTEGPAVDLEGRLYFTDVFRSKIMRINDQGKAEVFVDQSFGTNGMMFGPDGRLYGCQNGKKRIVAYDSAGKDTPIAEEANSNDLVVNRSGGVYFTDPGNQQIWYVPPKGEKRVVERGLGYANGIALTPDQGTLIVADMKSANLWTYRIEPDGGLKFKQPYYTLNVPSGKIDSGADGIRIDAAGRVYATSHLGLQVLDQQGRVGALIEKPQSAWLSNVVFAGPNLDTLYVTCTNKVYKRKVKAKGIRYFDLPGKS
jgi:sugar lactone lactonase YvrE